MKRKIFFWIDRLQITRAERITLSVLMGLILVLSAVITFYEPQPPDHEALYAELEAVFHERSKAMEEERAAILARYEPESQPVYTRLPAQEGSIDTNTLENSLSESEQMRSAADSVRININEATAEELQQLPGIGPAYSKRIVEWRNENGSFKTVDQLLEIRGIGPARLEKIRPFVVL